MSGKRRQTNTGKKILILGLQNRLESQVQIYWAKNPTQRTTAWDQNKWRFLDYKMKIEITLFPDHLPDSAHNYNLNRDPDKFTRLLAANLCTRKVRNS